MKETDLTKSKGFLLSPVRHISDYLEINARKTPAKLALVTAERSMTWSELWDEVQAGAAYIAPKLPTESQAIVGLLLANTWQHVVANLSIVHAGHIAMPIDVIFKPLEINAVIDQLQPTLLITDNAGSQRVDQSKGTLLDVSELSRGKPSVTSNYLRLSPEQQVASLIFTSGTTGKPKAVPNTHLNHIWNIQTCSIAWNWTADDTQLVSVRLSHMLGLILGLSGALYHGGTMYLEDRFDEQKTLELLASGKITLFSHGPYVYAKLLEMSANEKYDLSGVRLFISGSGPLPPAVWQEFKKVYGAEIMEVYGTTETGRIASNLLDERIPGSPGRILSGVEVKFDDDGQVMVKSPGVFPGYFGNDEETRAHRTGDGFWKTGDIGELVEGRLVLKGRLQERIRKQGYTISPRDVEWALHKDDRIKEVLVLGIQHPGQSNDTVVYFIVGDISEDEVKAFCAENLPSVWRPDQIKLLESLPRTRTGKADLNKLRAMVN